MKREEPYLLSAATTQNGDIVNIHANKNGLLALQASVNSLLAKLDEDICEHDHFMSESWGRDELTETMLQQEKEEGCQQVHHIKINAWTEEWKEKHKL